MFEFQFHFLLNIAVGCTNYYISDDSINRGGVPEYQKPWTNGVSQIEAMNDFYEWVGDFCGYFVVILFWVTQSKQRSTRKSKVLDQRCVADRGYERLLWVSQGILWLFGDYTITYDSINRGGLPEYQTPWTNGVQYIEAMNDFYQSWGYLWLFGGYIILGDSNNRSGVP